MKSTWKKNIILRPSLALFPDHSQFSMMHVENREGLGGEITYGQLCNRFVQQGVEKTHMNCTEETLKGITWSFLLVSNER